MSNFWRSNKQHGDYSSQYFIVYSTWNSPSSHCKKTGDYVRWRTVVIFCNINVYQTLTLYTLNLHSVMCQSYPSKASGREDSSQNLSSHSILYQLASSYRKTLHLFWGTPWCGCPEVGGREEWFSDVFCVSMFACLSVKHYSIWRYTEGRLGG